MATNIKNKEKKNIVFGIVHIKSTFNNTSVTITDMSGNVISRSSAGEHGFKGSRKATPYAAQITAEHASKNAIPHGIKTVCVKVRGAGIGREPAIRILKVVGFSITEIQDVTPIPYNGCRPKKKRRV